MITLEQLNYYLFLLLNQEAGHNGVLDGFMAFCANDLIFFLLIPILLLWGLPGPWRKQPLRPQETAVLQESRATLIWICVSCLIAMLMSRILASFVFEPRPFVSHHVHLLISHTADDSFPSDHATVSFAICGMFLFLVGSTLQISRYYPAQEKNPYSVFLLLRKPLLLCLLVVVACGLIGFARVFAGVHYPGDILAGALDGLIGAALTSAIRLRLNLVTGWVLQLAQRLHVA